MRTNSEVNKDSSKTKKNAIVWFYLKHKYSKHKKNMLLGISLGILQ